VTAKRGLLDCDNAMETWLDQNVGVSEGGNGLDFKQKLLTEIEKEMVATSRKVNKA
jgi:hypothetical protein